MRERLFRGKRINNGEWIYGATRVQEWCGRHSIIARGNNLSEFSDYEVFPETIEEYTGRNDKNGKRIFEGDLVIHNNIVFEIAYIAKYKRFAGKRPGTIMTIFNFEACEVIGNIHDNPELLEGANGYNG